MRHINLSRNWAFNSNFGYVLDQTVGYTRFKGLIAVEGVKPIKEHRVCHVNDVLYKSTNYQEVFDFMESLRNKNPLECYHIETSEWFLPENSFIVLRKGDNIKLKAGLDDTNRLLVFFDIFPSFEDIETTEENVVVLYKQFGFERKSGQLSVVAVFNPDSVFKVRIKDRVLVYNFESFK